MNDLDLFIAGGVVTFLAAAGAVASTLHQVGARPDGRAERRPTPQPTEAPTPAPVTPASEAEG